MALIEGLDDVVDSCADSFVDVTRFTATEPISGDPQPDSEETVPNVAMATGPLSSEDLLQLDEGARTEGGVSVITTTKLQKKDEFTLNGLVYKVVTADDWFAQGNFARYICRKAVV